MSLKKCMNIIAFVLALFIFIVINKLLAFLFIILYLVRMNLATIIYYIGSNKYKRNKIDEAYKYFEKAYNVNFSPMKIKLYYIYYLLLKGDLKKSENLLNQLSNKKVTPDDEINIKLNISIVLWKRNNIDEAVNILMKLYSKYKSSIIYQNLGYFLLLQNNYTKALEINLEAYKFNSSNAGIIDNLATTYYMLGEYDKSLKLYEELMLEKPSFPSAYYYYASTLLNLNKPQEALENLKEALKCNFTFLSAISKEEIDTKITEIETSIK
ncbi:tetratricopeptide repeat protein [Clostridium estertheticum]|uniref:tetratricopeptide repeat protein n=1 Tax=Clostridium estertheticum TaxID=238834 RepID=UPI001C0B1C51|nr:tetratricopeptide repeat protein [Clostridium estertheticum]MBU3072801.1 tetratricopeptide repeat protein [Clostridium estertheticum]MBU3163162.1 tetratricopeptide repeat protein [Clostridium estertheticum]